MNERGCGEATKDIAIVTLNYLAAEETRELLESALENFPGARVIVVDNGSPEPVREKLKQTVALHGNARLELLPGNLGFARGFNHGIAAARKEGFRFVAVSNNDVLFNDKRLFDSLRNTYGETSCAVVGPRILSADGFDQNPFMFSRPSARKAKAMYRKAFYWNFLKIPVLKVFPGGVFRYARARKWRRENTRTCALLQESGKTQVYALHGAFMFFTPRFFEHYQGFYDGTFLFGEEMILAEMLYQKSLKSFLDSNVSVLHKEDRTSRLIWGNQVQLEPLMHARRSAAIWYKDFYLNS